MKYAMACLPWFIALSLGSMAVANAATDSCATVGQSTSTQYINSTITLKILLVEFSDVHHRTSPSVYTKTDFENLLVSSGIYVTGNMNSPDGDAVYGSLRDYFQKMSSGNLTVAGYVVNTASSGIPTWIVLPNSKSYYHSFAYWNSPIFTDAINAATTAGLDVSTSSTVKLAIIYAGNTYWSKKGLNPMASGDSYIMSELQGVPSNQENTTDKFSRIGSHCHEFAHTLGVGHASGSRADLMEAGYRNGPDNRGAAPAPLNPAHRALKGWLTPTVITGQQQINALYSLTSPKVYRINSNSDDVYFLFENRRFDQTMIIGSTTVPDYNNAAFFPPAWPHGTIAQGIFAWRIVSGGPTDYCDNGLIYASGSYGATCPEGNPSETDDGVPFPGNCDVRVLSPYSGIGAGAVPQFSCVVPLGPPFYFFVPSTQTRANDYNGNVGMEVLSENRTSGYFTIMLYQTHPIDASPVKPNFLQVNSHTACSTTISWWNGIEPDLVGFNVYRGVVYAGSGEPTYTKINTSLVPQYPATYTDNAYETTIGLPQNIDLYHRYRITAVDNQGKESVKSDYVDAYFAFILSTQVANSWNMLGVPVVEWDFAKNAVWAGANSSAYTWEGGPLYVAKDPVANRIGYWVEYHPAQNVTYIGVPKDSFHISVAADWNMIGSLYSDIPKSKIIPVNTQFTSEFFGYDYGYFTSDTIKAGKGYWIKVNCPGTLIMDRNATPGGGGILCGQQPPNPSEAPQPPILASPANGSTDVLYVPTLSWNSSTGATSYSLQGSTNECFTTLAFNYSGLTTTSKQVGPLSYHTIYYWRVNASNATATSNWSSTWSFTTENAPPTNPCDTYSSMKPLDEFTVSDAKGNGQKLYVGNGGKGFALPFSDFEMPPITPKGVFHAKFNSGKFIESVPPGKGLSKLTIKVKDAVLPLTLSWVVKEPNKITYWISKPGKDNTTIKLSGTGNTVVESSKDGDLIIIARAIDPCPEKNAAIGAEQLDDLLTTPIKYSLEQNSPNPFNPHTVIEYSLPEAAYVVLNVYNILGEEVQTLVNENQDIGYKAVRFDASELPSGVYLYKLTAGAFTEVKKMILMK